MKKGPAWWVDFFLCDSDRVLPCSLFRPFLLGEAQLCLFLYSPSPLSNQFAPGPGDACV